MNKSQVDILLATYNGEVYLEPLLESIFSQTHSCIHVIARDDCSTDGTLSILNKWAEKFPAKFTIIPALARVGIRSNFSELLSYSHAPYVAFADQDDVWHKNKIELTLQTLQDLEQVNGAHMPLLVYTDLAVVDKDLAVIHPSFWRYSGLKPINSFPNLLSQNTVTGCTMLFNRSLVNLIGQIPKEVIMHDWWIALIASCFGHIRPLAHQTIMYRQHTQNDTGAKRYSFINFMRKCFKESNHASSAVLSTHDQSKLFLSHFDVKLTYSSRKLLSIYATLHKQSFIKRAVLIMQHRFFKQGLLRNLRWLIAAR